MDPDHDSLQDFFLASGENYSPPMRCRRLKELGTSFHEAVLLVQVDPPYNDGGTAHNELAISSFQVGLTVAVMRFPMPVWIAVLQSGAEGKPILDMSDLKVIDRGMIYRDAADAPTRPSCTT